MQQHRFIVPHFRNQSLAKHVSQKVSQESVSSTAWGVYVSLFILNVALICSFPCICHHMERRHGALKRDLHGPSFCFQGEWSIQ